MGSENDIRELAVIGGGPGGYAAAFHAADLGVKVTLIDKEENPGGVCLYRGCIPSKALLHAARVIKDAQKAKDFGIDFGEPEVDIDKLREWKNSVISKLVRGLGSLCKKRQIEYIQGTAEFTGKDRIRVQRTDKKAEEIGFKNAIVATGTHIISLPSIPMDSENVIDSDMSLEIKDVPESMLVIGGGYIGLEQANIYARLGSKVSVVEMTSQLLPGSDEELVSILTDYLKKECLEKVILNTKVSGIEETSEGIRVSFEGEAEESSGQTYQKVLVAVGRKPNTQGIGLENAGVKVDEKGFIPVDKQRRTNVNNIFAVGDITGDPQFAHKATHEGMIAGEVIAGRQAAFDVHAIPFVEYTELELAGCGLSEQQARERGIETQVTKFPWSASGRAWTLGEGKGLTKLIFEASSGRLLGVGIVGSDAGKLISEATVAIEMAATATDLARTIHPHPTLSETIMEAAENFLDGSISGG
jgi:dihydrolipoamide dehydrogenase